MLVVYTPIILFEAAVAGGISFLVTKVVQSDSQHFGNISFFVIFAALDLMYRYWRRHAGAKSMESSQYPAPPQPPPETLNWLLSINGGMLLFVPGWVIGIIGVIASSS